MGAVRLNPQVIPSTTTPNTASISTGISNIRYSRQGMTAIRKAALDTGVTEKQAARQVQRVERANTTIKVNTGSSALVKKN